MRRFGWREQADHNTLSETALPSFVMHKNRNRVASGMGYFADIVGVSLVPPVGFAQLLAIEIHRSFIIDSTDVKGCACSAWQGSQFEGATECGGVSGLRYLVALIVDNGWFPLRIVVRGRGDGGFFMRRGHDHAPIACGDIGVARKESIALMAGWISVAHAENLTAADFESDVVIGDRDHTPGRLKR